MVTRGIASFNLHLDQTIVRRELNDGFELTLQNPTISALYRSVESADLSTTRSLELSLSENLLKPDVSLSYSDVPSENFVFLNLSLSRDFLADIWSVFDRS
jgi:hypothetical protein